MADMDTKAMQLADNKNMNRFSLWIIKKIDK